MGRVGSGLRGQSYVRFRKKPSNWYLQRSEATTSVPPWKPCAAYMVNRPDRAAPKENLLWPEEAFSVNGDDNPTPLYTFPPASQQKEVTTYPISLQRFAPLHLSLNRLLPGILHPGSSSAGHARRCGASAAVEAAHPGEGLCEVYWRNAATSAPLPRDPCCLQRLEDRERPEATAGGGSDDGDYHPRDGDKASQHGSRLWTTKE